ncbi:MAG TPA: hypothetical protein VFS56_10670, partial [Gemmatimonadaceae bacterium]|nr:hypothetical protein [Gemmatimonadaceae bacterium]
MAIAPWLGAYAGILTLWSLALVLGRRPTLWKGRSLLILNLAFVVVVLLTSITRGDTPDNALVSFLISIILAGIIVSRLWLLFHVDRAAVGQLIEKCLRQTLAKYEQSGDRYIVHTAGKEMVIRIHGDPPVMRVRLSGGSGSKKAVLIRSLFGKQFSGSFPTLRVRTWSEA